MQLNLLITCFCSSTIAQPPLLDIESLYSFPKKGELKWAVVIQSPIGICSGSIIDKSWILTAAQCFYLDGRGVTDTGVNITAGISDYQRPELYVNTLQFKTSLKIITHPDFIEDVFSKFDIALIKTNEPFNFTSHAVGKVDISATSWPVQKKEAKNCILWKFGDIEPGIKKKDSRLKMRETSALHGAHACPCTKKFQWERLVCIKDRDGVSLCDGDTGSSLVCYDQIHENITQPFVYGVAHMIMTKHLCGYERIPPEKGCPKIPVENVYMYLCPFNDWIAHYVPGIPHTPVSCKGSHLLCNHVFYILYLLFYGFLKI